MNLKDKRVLVVGLGKSGTAAALFLQSQGARVTVSDSRSELQLRPEIPTLLDRGIVIETGGHGERTFRAQDLIVVSPGVPLNVPQLAHARALNLPIIGELELAARFLKGHIVAISGSNGKTTTTSLCGDILAKAGKKTQVGGNIGTPVIELAERAQEETYNVLEVSSFQLETIATFHPELAVILNITPDHLDRHGDFHNYVEAKARIFENQSIDDYVVLNADNEPAAALAPRVKGKVTWFSRSPSRKQGFDVGSFVSQDQMVFLRDGRETPILATHEMPLKGAHNVENVLAAICVGMLTGCAPEDIRRAILEFKAVEHRLELVATVKGVEYYNDSKATNVDAAIKAIESFPANIHLILGGKDKNSDYTVMRDLIHERVKRVYTIGAAAQKIESELAGSGDILSVKTLEAAIRRATESAQAGDVVLLAPACSSFDQFQNYEHRGSVFKELVHTLARESVRSEGG